MYGTIEIRGDFEGVVLCRGSERPVLLIPDTHTAPLNLLPGERAVFIARLAHILHRLETEGTT